MTAPPGAGVAQVFSSWRGIHVAIDLAGLAIAGGLFIVPAFSAVQSWAGADKRARVVAAVNVLNALFIVGGTLVVAALQAFGVTLPQLFLLLGAANIVALVVIARTMPANGLRDFLTTMLRAMLGSTSRLGAPSPVRGMSRLAPQHRRENTTIIAPK